MRVPGQARQMVCYHCPQPGHMRRDCPQRQGSQGFGTAQSQIAVGQERIQYIPPQPGTGQRSQSQFQGATRGPPISQASPRGQSMGRGKGRGPQAGTVSGLASEPYPRGRGETRLRSTSSSVRICGCFSR